MELLLLVDNSRKLTISGDLEPTTNPKITTTETLSTLGINTKTEYMTKEVLEAIINNHQKSLDTCKQLVKEGRLEVARRILCILTNNIGALK